MKDVDVRRALHASVLAEHHDDLSTRVIDEMGVWSGTVRIDVAVLNGEICGYEIKSDRDTLERLPYQIEIYSKVFDKLTLVVGRRHEKAAADLIPKWWGIVVAKERGGTVVLSHRRKARQNPRIDDEVLVQLLWKEEAVSLLADLGHARGWKSKRLKDIYAKLLEVSQGSDLSRHVREIVKRREGWLGQKVSH